MNTEKTCQKSNEIESFNSQVSEVPTLMELDEMDLEEVAGGDRSDDQPYE